MTRPGPVTERKALEFTWLHNRNGKQEIYQLMIISLIAQMCWKPLRLCKRTDNLLLLHTSYIFFAEFTRNRDV